MTLKYKVENQVLHPCGPMRKTIELSRNVVYLELAFDTEWDGASVTVLFENSGLQEPVAVLWTGEPVAVPAECLITGELRIGCVGLKDAGETRLTTLRMARGLQIYKCAGIAGISTEEQTPELWEQVQAVIGNMADLQTTDKTTLVAAINEVLSQVGTGGGTIDPAEIAQAVEDYLEANPPAQEIPIVDSTLTESGQAADAKATGDKLRSLSEEIANIPSGGSGLTTAEKTAMLTLFKAAAYTSDVSATIADLETLWSGGTVEPDEPEVPDVPDADVSQSGSVLSIVSGVTVNQSGSVLAIA